MKILKNIIKSTVLTSIITVSLCIPVFASVTSTVTGPLFTVNPKDTVMSSTIDTNQKISIKNNTGKDLEIILDHVYQGYIPNGGTGSFTSTSDKNLTANHKVVKGMHVLMITSTEKAKDVSQPDKTQQIAAIDAQIAQLSAYCQQAQAIGNAELVNTCANLIQTLNMQKAALMK